MPATMAWVLREWEHGRVSEGDARRVATLCTDCGACQTHCHIHEPLPERLRQVRSALVPFVEPASVQAAQGAGKHLVVEADERPVAAWLSAFLGEDVRRLGTSDHLGASQMHHRQFEQHRRALSAQLDGEPSVIVTDGRVARVLRSADVAFRWLHELVSLPGGAVVGSCSSGGERPMACCGGFEPLRSHHPADARRVGRRFGLKASTSTFADWACASHLRECGLEVTDVADALRREVGA